MSQAQFVEYRQSGFWAYDVALGVFLKHLIDVAEEKSLEHEESWLAEAVNWWRVVACVNSYGLAIGEDWSPAQVATFVGLAREASVRIGRRQSFSATEMEAWSIWGATSCSCRHGVVLWDAFGALHARDASYEREKRRVMKRKAEGLRKLRRSTGHDGG